MRITQRWVAVLTILLTFCTALLAADAPILRVAYAGSMGVVMDSAAGPAFAKDHHATYQGIGQGSYALARLLAAHQLQERSRAATKI